MERSRCNIQSRFKFQITKLDKLAALKLLNNSETCIVDQATGMAITTLAQLSLAQQGKFSLKTLQHKEDRS